MSVVCSNKTLLDTGIKYIKSDLASGLQFAN